MDLMKAIVCSKYGPPEVLRIESCERPIPKDNEVLIKIYATSVTNSDIFIRSSKVRPLMLIPFRIMIGITKPRNKIIGQVFAGVIERVGNGIRKFSVGDKVYGLTGFSLGAYADYKTMKEVNSKQGCFSLMPRNIGFEEATSAAYGGLLALQFLEKKNIGKGTRVLIYGASSTSGIFALQFAKHLGAEVTCVCRENKFEFVQSLGADKVIDYSKDESIAQLEHYSLIFDCVGKARKSNLRNECMNHITNKTDFISIDDEALLLSSERLVRIKNLVEEKIIEPINGKIFRFDQIVEAHKYVELGHKIGNVAIVVNSETSAFSTL